MDYIQRTFALSIKDKKDVLFERYNSLKAEIIEHCKVAALNGLVNASDDGILLRLQFPDLDYEAYAKPRIAFNEEWQAGLRINFYDNRNDWVMGLILHPNGYFSLDAKRGGPYAPYEHGDQRLPMVVIHALLTSAHQSGRLGL
ncbi:hypothetical protein [Pantoea agglomerans]